MSVITAIENDAKKVVSFIEGLPNDLNKVTGQYLPVITTLVKQAEALFPAASSGASKLAYVVGIMGNIQNELTSTAVSALVGTLVSAFNQGGVFSKGTITAAAAPTS